MASLKTAQRLIKIDRLRDIYFKCAIEAGADAEGAQTFAQCLSLSDLRHETQGVSLFCEFILPQIREGRIHFNRPRHEELRPALISVDAGGCAGQITLSNAMDEIVDRAKRLGVAMALVRETGDIGMASAYAMRALEHDTIGVVVCRGAAPLVAPWGAKKGLFGTNPIAVAVPAGRNAPIVIDMSPSLFSVGTLVQAAKRDERSDAACVVTMEGEYSNRPLDIVSDVGRREPPLLGALLPFGVKGSALLVLTEMLAGALNAAPLNIEPQTSAFSSCCLIAIDIAAALDPAQFKRQVDAFIDYATALPPAQGFSQILLPGQRAAELARERMLSGILVREDHWRTLSAFE
jgi:LDH2 family malate/lactate/ureidoglycolate dehydrogenase